MDDLLTWLRGRKTYLLAGLTVIGVWARYFTAALPEQCSAVPVPAGVDCSQPLTLQAAIALTIGALGFMTVRAGIKTEAVQVVAATKNVAPATAAKAMAKARK